MKPARLYDTLTGEPRCGKTNVLIFIRFASLSLFE